MNLLRPIFELHYAQRMMIAGGVMVVIGFFGFALEQNRKFTTLRSNEGREREMTGLSQNELDPEEDHKQRSCSKTARQPRWLLDS